MDYYVLGCSNSGIVTCGLAFPSGGLSCGNSSLSNFWGELMTTSSFVTVSAVSPLFLFSAKQLSVTAVDAISIISCILEYNFVYGINVCKRINFHRPRSYSNTQPWKSINQATNDNSQSGERRRRQHKRKLGADKWWEWQVVLLRIPNLQPNPRILPESKSAIFCGRKWRFLVVCSRVNIYLSGGAVQMTLRNCVCGRQCGCVGD